MEPEVALDAFRDDIAAQGSVIRGLAAASAPGGPLAGELAAAAGHLADRDRAIVLVAMGSSLHAAHTVLPRLAATGRFAVAVDAGELLHFGLEGLPGGAVLIAMSQSGRSAETVTVVERLRAGNGARPIVAIVNDTSSRLAAIADVAVGIRAGAEASVATKTFVATAVTLQLLADAIARTETARTALPALADVLDAQAGDERPAIIAADRMAGLRSLVLVGRGPGLGVARYGALTIKETAAFPAEALSGGAFRHGPLELVDAPSGAAILVPRGPSGMLAIRLVLDTARMGWPVWVLGSSTDLADLSRASAEDLDPGRVLLTALPDLDPTVSALALAVSIQQLAAKLAQRRGRVAGRLLHGSKVTTTE